jgi:hypothetical protein
MATDRRAHPRLEFTDRPSVELRAGGGPHPGPLAGEARDLSLGGVGVVLGASIDPAQFGTAWDARLRLPDPTGVVSDVRLACEVVRGERQPDGRWLYGLRFLNTAGPAQAPGGA